jgi:predicted glycogen debranching enzyme
MKRPMADDVVTLRTIPWSRSERSQPEPLLTREWLVTNGLGGYASGTLSGVATRRYHGLLVAALPAPLGRLVMLNHLAERLVLPGGTRARLGGLEREGELDVPAAAALVEFRLEDGLPVWRYELGTYALEKRVLMPYQQNTALVMYRLLSGHGRVSLRLRPGLNVRPHEDPVSTPLGGPYTLQVQGDQYEIHPGAGRPPLRLWICGRRPSLVVQPRVVRGLLHRIERRRGYPDVGDLWTPGAFEVALKQGQPATLIASVEDWVALRALEPEEAVDAERRRRHRLIEQAPPAARQGVAAELVLAADQFLITPAGRLRDAARARASGQEVRTVIAGYHWFTDWGRDTMISLDGLTLATGRHREAASLLRTFAQHVRDGLIPNLFPEGESEGLYHTADATLWMFHAIDRYLEATGDRDLLRDLLPTLREIVAQHRRGTRFGIGVDPADGLLRQGAEGYQLTWMDAKVDGWVVTPRRGKAVEINALWYNALRLMEGWLRDSGAGEDAGEIGAEASRMRASFGRRFWNEPAGCLFDVVDGESGDDPAVRPNQILAIALRHPVLDGSRWDAVLETVREALLTPVGLRSLAAGHPDYKARYDGDLRSRDAAYHQGTVWGWLIGPFVDAWLKVHPDDRPRARAFLEGFRAHLGEAGLGSISEIFDAEAPFTPRGCIAQAWSVAEVLRCWLASEPAGVAADAASREAVAGGS